MHPRSVRRSDAGRRRPAEPSLRRRCRSSARCAGRSLRRACRRLTTPGAGDPSDGYGWPMPGRRAGKAGTGSDPATAGRCSGLPPPPPTRPAAPLAEPGRPTHARPAATAPRHDRLGRHDRRRRRDRAARQGLRRQPVPHPVVVDGADAALLPSPPSAARRSRRPDRSLRPRSREPLPLPAARPAAGRDHRLRDAARSAAQVRRRRHVRQAPDRAARRHRGGEAAQRATATSTSTAGR